jgi:flavin reductase (DIM6/NTAB) family NADH-FMN oxidoreductase RutF
MNALEKLSYGFYIVTTRHHSEEMRTREEDYLAAGTVSWAMQTSFEPAMVTIAVKRGSDLQETISKSRNFALNVVGKAEKPMLKEFTQKTEVSGDTINGHKFEDGVNDCPVLKDTPAHLSCEVLQEMASGDHTLFVSQVKHQEVRNPDAEPLMVWETEYHYAG